MTRVVAGVVAWLVVSASAVSTAVPVGQGAAPGGTVLVFAAASLQTVLDALAPTIRQAVGVEVRVSYAATSALARQIERAAPADLFISADLVWMDYLEERNAIRTPTRVTLLGNDLVLVAPAGRVPDLTIGPGFPLAAALEGGRLAVADPDAVPAGRYARAALESLGAWASVEPHLARADNVRAALLLVSRGEAPLGIVYRTDARADRGVEIVGVFPSSSHPPIVYPAAVTRDAPAPEAALSVLAFLQTDAARRVFEAHGFRSPAGREADGGGLSVVPVGAAPGE